jgi:hypothetical protein
MPGSHAELKHSRGRYLVEHVTDLPEEIIESDRISVIDPHADGLAGEVLVVRPGETVAGPDPSRTSGQHYVVLAGDVVANGRLYAWLSNAYVAPDEPLPNFTAGDQGLALLALGFPAKTTF